MLPCHVQDCLSLKPASVFLALSVLHQYVVRVGGQSLERKEARDLQDINAKLMEAVAAIAGSRLEVGRARKYFLTIFHAL